jgi:hypothetical protein
VPSHEFHFAQQPLPAPVFGLRDKPNAVALLVTAARLLIERLYVSVIDRDAIYNKYGGKCAYSGTLLEDDWQIDHFIPKCMLDRYNPDKIDPNGLDNLMPTQKVINHYKRGLWLEDFRNLRLKNLHLRLIKLPKSPRVNVSIRRKKYMLKIAGYFGITPDKPFSGKFYFESLHSNPFV